MTETPDSTAASTPGALGDRVSGDITAAQISTGYKLYVEKDGEKRLAEVLSTHTRKGVLQFYVHFEGFNKRLDDWVPETRLDLSMPVHAPAPEKPKESKKSAPVNGKADKVVKKGRPTKAAAANKAAAAAAAAGGAGEDDDKEMMDLDEVSRPNGNAIINPEDYDRDEEIEKLRTSGSMTQNSHEVARIRNLNKVIMGAHVIEPWYFSPYPIEFTEEDVIYICEFSLCYFASRKQFERFRAKSALRHPPGNEIYRDEKFSFFEIDGRRQRTWCRNLCLFSKLFLDHKTLYYDVDPFLFYCMTKRDEMGHHLVGYFSKEKESADAYNVACILTLPQYQRHGYGRVLIDFSYNLSKKEGKLGSPEKPLSDLGLLSYRAYWADAIVDLMVESKKTDMTIEDVATATAMTTTDILHTMQYLNMLKYYKGQHIICLTDAVMEKYEKQRAKQRHKIDPAKLRWKPPQFTAAQLRFAW